MPWTSGQSGNRRGRPRKGTSFKEALVKALAIKDPETKRTQLQYIVDAAIDRAKAGDLDAIRFIAERLDGKVPESVQQSGSITVRVIYVDEQSENGSESESGSPGMSGEHGSRA